MPDYSKAKIYKLSYADKYYYGSTCLRLCERKALHHAEIKKGKTSKVYQYLRDKPWDAVEIVLIESFPCTSREELLARETFYIEPYREDPNCLNNRVALPTEESKEVQRIKNLKSRSDVIVCECGASIARGYLSQHRKMKAHCDALGIEYVPNTIRSKESREKQKATASEREKSTVTCECGAVLKYGSLYLHKKKVCPVHSVALRTFPIEEVGSGV